MALDDTLDVFYGAVSNVSAAVYARVPRLPEWERATLAGRVVGPECDLACSLPIEIKLVDAGPGETLLARASIPDPTYWTPYVPARYVVKVELRQGGNVIDTATRWLGIRPLGAKGSSLFLESYRWVPRGMTIRKVGGGEDENLEAWKAADAAMLVEEPSDALCEAASRQGVLLVAGVRHGFTFQCVELQRLARWPAVAIACVQPHGRFTLAEHSPRKAAPNILPIATHALSKETEPPEWAEGLFVAAAEKEQVAQLAATHDLPIVAFRPLGEEVTVEAGRAACDRLQADLAPGDYAGYFV